MLSPKVLAAGAGAGGGTVVGALVLWILGALLFGGSWDAVAAPATVAAVPGPLHDAVLLVLAITGAIIGGYVKVDPDRNGPIPNPATDIEGEILPDVPMWGEEPPPYVAPRQEDGTLALEPDVEAGPTVLPGDDDGHA